MRLDGDWLIVDAVMPFGEGSAPFEWKRDGASLVKFATRKVAKGGAAAILDRGVGVAVKIRDGSARAAGPALIGALRAFGALDRRQLEALAPHATPPVLGGGRQVGELVVEVELGEP